MQYCPHCRTELVQKEIGGHDRLTCPAPGCNFVHWDNPVPVAAVIVQRDKHIILANNVSWPEHVYSVITGFVEKGETPAQTVVREVDEELGLAADAPTYVGMYPFHTMNQLILAYHVHASGDIRLGEELRSVKPILRTDLRPWRGATGTAVRDWLIAEGLYEMDGGEKEPAVSRGALYARIDRFIRMIPRGRVATYGQIAKLAGGCTARQVGYALASLPEQSDVPWHRVINSQGRISKRSGSDGDALQRVLLEAEGVTIDDGRIRLADVRWNGPPAGQKEFQQ